MEQQGSFNEEELDLELDFLNKNNPLLIPVNGISRIGES
jgi:hypothetical protein